MEGWLFDGGDFVFSLGEGFLLLINGGGGGMVCLGCLRLWGFIIVGILGYGDVFGGMCLLMVGDIVCLLCWKEGCGDFCFIDGGLLVSGRVLL